MSKFGLDKKGFKRARYREIVDSMNFKAKELFGENVNLSERSPLGMIIKITAFTVGEIWQLAEDVYFSAFKDYAKGTNLDNVAQYIGIKRRNATYSIGEVTFTGSEGTIVTEGTLVSRLDGVEFRTLKTVTIVDASAIVDVISTTRGSIGNSPIGTVVEIVNIIEGLDEVTNAEIIDGGLEVETDDDFRKRYDISVSKIGSSTIDSIRATLLDTENVTDVIVDENVTMKIKDGIPPKSIAPIVLGGTDADIAKAIFDTKAGGIQSFGTILIEVKDTLYRDHTIGFSRPEEVKVNIVVNLDTNNKFPGDGEELVKESIIRYIGGMYKEDNYLGVSLNEDVIYTKVICSIHNVPGITDIPTLTLNGESANIGILNGQVATIGTISVGGVISA